MFDKGTELPSGEGDQNPEEFKAPITGEEQVQAKQEQEIDPNQKELIKKEVEYLKLSGQCCELFGVKVEKGELISPKVGFPEVRSIVEQPVYLEWLECKLKRDILRLEERQKDNIQQVKEAEEELKKLPSYNVPGKLILSAKITRLLNEYPIGTWYDHDRDDNKLHDRLTKVQKEIIGEHDEEFTEKICRGIAQGHGGGYFEPEVSWSMVEKTTSSSLISAMGAMAERQLLEEEVK